MPRARSRWPASLATHAGRGWPGAPWPCSPCTQATRRRPGKWITDARRRCDRLPDRYVWVSGFVALGHLEIAASQQHELVMPLARRLYQDGLRADLPEFIAWALIYQAEAGDLTKLPLARTLAAGIVNPALQARVTALEDPHTSAGEYPPRRPATG